MPITGRSLWHATLQLCEHLNHVLATTVTQTRLVPVEPRAGATLIHVSFRQRGQPIEAPLAARFGRLRLYLGQVCDGVPLKDGQVQLRTLGYKYTLTVDDEVEPLFRWEFGRQMPGFYCRHHLQGAVPLQIGRHAVSLNDLHLPTGYVRVEEILRFCVADLGVRPRSEEWDWVLRDSYERLKSELGE